MSFEETISDVVEKAVRRAVAPLEAELARLRAERIPDHITIPEFARRAGVTPRAVQRWIKAGELEPTSIGGVRLVRWPPVTLKR